MTWVQIDDRMWRNPKLDRLSDRAFRTYVRALTWTAEHQMDGAVPHSAWAKLCPSRKWRTVVAELVAAGLVHPPGESCDSCDAGCANRVIRAREYADSHIHEWLTFNPSNHEIRTRRAKDAERKKRRSKQVPTPDGLVPFPGGGSERKSAPEPRAPARGQYKNPQELLMAGFSAHRPVTQTDARENGAITPTTPIDALVAAVRAVRPYWSPFDIVAAATVCAAQGRTYDATLSAFLRIADDPRATYPSRVIADGPWWRPVTTPSLVSRSDQRVRRILDMADKLEEQEALEKRQQMRAIDGGQPE